MTDVQIHDLQTRALEAAREGVLDAIETHRRMGRSIVVWEDGQIKHIKAKDLPPRALPGDEDDDETS